MPLLPVKANTAENNETLGDRTPIPAADYQSMIVKTEFKETKAKTGHYLSVHHKIIDGKFAGRLIFSNLNLDNPNTVAVEIAHKELNSICKAVNKQGVADSDELLELPMTISVAIEPASAQYPASNKITAYKPAVGAAPMADPSAMPVQGDEVATEVAQGEVVPADAGADAQPVEAAAPGKLPWE